MSGFGKRVSLAGLMMTTMALFAPESVSAMSPYAVGYQWESYNDVRYKKDAGQNPTYHPAVNDVYEFDRLSGWVVEEPGVIIGLITGVYGTKANEIEARNKAIRERELMYRYAYARPPEMPTSRWWRWAWITGEGRVRGDSVQTAYYNRIDAHIVMTPRLLTESGIYWMPSSSISFTWVKLGQNKSSADHTFGPMTLPLNLHLGWQPSFFPWLMVEGQGGWDFLQWGLASLAHTEGYTQGWNYGGKVSLGTNWVSLYHQRLESNQPTYNTRKEGGWGEVRGSHAITGIRLDLGVLAAMAFGIL